MTHKIIYSTKAEDFYYTDINIPCQSACPVHTNIPAYIRTLYENQADQSYEINRMANILPGVLGRICSRPCEKKCRHGEAELGQPVNICHLKRAASDFKSRMPEFSPVLKPLEKKVAIIGSGPAGLAAAHDLARFGFDVTLYEALEKPGGMLRYGIPEFRLPRNVLDDEIDAILKMGVSLKTGIRVGENMPLDALLNSHDAVLAATGCYRSIALDIPGETTLAGVYPGLEFMMDVCSGKNPPVGKRVLVIGAGFTAFDCARSAQRLGGEDVIICIRRTEEDLTVTHDEILETKIEGVKIRSLMLSREIIGKTGVEGVEFVRTRPGEKRPDGKRDVSVIPGSEFVLPADTVIVATGQVSGPFELPGEGTKEKNRDSLKTTTKGLYITGDYLTGPSTVIQAIAMGRNAAHEIAMDLVGKAFYENTIRMEDAGITDRERAWDFFPREKMPTIMPIEKRLSNPRYEVEIGQTLDQAINEAKRCYLCYLHYEIDLDRCIYCRYCVDVAPRDCIKLVKDVKINDVGAVAGFVETTVWQDVNAIVIDNNRCIRCGQCMRVCPVECISVTRVEMVEKDTGGQHG
jgi:NADPH-dependent glutamate synthase beta subunit-like oxidoreductase/ferredoxin